MIVKDELMRYVDDHGAPRGQGRACSVVFSLSSTSVSVTAVALLLVRAAPASGREPSSGVDGSYS